MSVIRYVRNGGVAIAYQVLGDGDIDLVYVPDYMSNLSGSLHARGDGDP